MTHCCNASVVVGCCLSRQVNRKCIVTVKLACVVQQQTKFGGIVSLERRELYEDVREWKQVGD